MASTVMNGRQQCKLQPRASVQDLPCQRCAGHATLQLRNPVSSLGVTSVHPRKSVPGTLVGINVKLGTDQGGEPTLAGRRSKLEGMVFQRKGAPAPNPEGT